LRCTGRVRPERQKINLIVRDDLLEDLFDVRREFDKIFNPMLTVNSWG